ASSPRTPPALIAILMRLLRKDPQDRYQTAAHLLHDLTRPARLAPVLDREPSPRTKGAAHGAAATLTAPRSDAPEVSSDADLQELTDHDRDTSTLKVPDPKQYRATVAQFDRARQAVAA